MISNEKRGCGNYTLPQAQSHEITPNITVPFGYIQEIRWVMSAGP
jgi:hypothetical protein